MNFGRSKAADVLPAIRSMFANVSGENNSLIPTLPEGMPEDARVAAVDGVKHLIDYQGASYAQLYIARLRRFIGRRNLDAEVFADIARLLAVRMAYDDPVRMAQLKLAEFRMGSSVPSDIRKLRLDELVSMLPKRGADPVLSLLDRFGWRRLPVTIRFSAASGIRLRCLRIEASLRRWRLSSLRYANERVWVERWLHMIDRSLEKQPAAVAAVIATAEMVRGYGDGYIQSLRDWNLIIDHVVKPTFDGAIVCSDLGAAITEARAAVRYDPRQELLKRVIVVIRERAGTDTRWAG
ncbi:hypothetical protein NB311A_03634 [Nitrobacter sp. Nb-311A]|uniref:DUF6537 domain-containing protein n=2 Tax=Nitrobacter TaxID=911 RepID=UPI00006863A4|nr:MULTISPECIES: DUF6537 domain-containing protein [unclassified Nitrobacter]EAQ37368.1 hypothetical protein NB311A_03634 [Nitrobacter sp. Nb-311A]MCB1392505.1 hypothetical protein [Nitrobacter sp.]MCV0384817.1 hypothetical protein [Nitrobacter sp.]